MHASNTLYCNRKSVTYTHILSSQNICSNNYICIHHNSYNIKLNNVYTWYPHKISYAPKIYAIIVVFVYTVIVITSSYTNNMMYTKMLIKCFKNVPSKTCLNPYFQNLIKLSPSNMSKQRWQRAIIGDFRGLCQNCPTCNP